MPLSIGHVGHSILYKTCWGFLPRRINLSAHRPRFIVLAAKAQRKHEIVKIPIGLSGSIKLDVFSPRHSKTDGGETQRNLLVHLPPGPSLGPSLHPWPPFDEQSSLLAFASPSTTIVTVHYRLGTPDVAEDANASKTTCFPTPVHDVAEALYFLTSASSPFNDGQEFQPKISLLGTRLGGALAAMLALTQPNDVHALTMIEPLVDWVGLDELVKQLRAGIADTADESMWTVTTPSKKPARRRHRGLSFPGVDNESVLAAAEELLSLRSRLFRTHSAYFDPFASPILFLRAPGRDTPLVTVGDGLMREMGIDDVQSIDDDDESFGPYDDDWGVQSNSSPSERSSTTDPTDESIDQPTSTSSSEAGFVSDMIAPESSEYNSQPSSPEQQPQQPAAAHQPRRRKVLRRWPEVGRPEDVLLPHTRIFVRSKPLLILDKDKQQHDAATLLDRERGLQALLHAQGAEFAELMRRACFYGRESGFANERVQVLDAGGGGGAEASSGIVEADDDGSSVYQQAALWADQVLKED